MASVQIVAEIGTNWEPGNLESALEIVRVAKTCGADAVKFQAWRTAEIDRPQEWKDRCGRWELPEHWIPVLREYAKEYNMQFFFSVFDKWGADTSHWQRMEIVKIAASEIGNRELLRSVNKNLWEQKVYLSVDYRKLGAVVPALTWLPDCAVTLLYCVSKYPAELPPADLFEDLKDYGLPVGWSSHVPFPEAVTAAEFFAKNGATAIEAHLRTKDTPAECPDNGPWALYPEEFTDLVKAVRDAS